MIDILRLDTGENLQYRIAGGNTDSGWMRYENRRPADRARALCADSARTLIQDLNKCLERAGTRSFEERRLCYARSAVDYPGLPEIHQD